MKLSVIMPCYNKPTYLIEMVKTIMAQTFADWELIIVDDGSEDVNYNMVNEFVSQDNRITLLRRNRLPKNGDTCRNIGMDFARGEYLIIFDSDDLVSETCFEKRVAFMEEHPECDYATFPSSSFVDGTNSYLSRKFDKNVKDILGDILNADYPFTVWGNIYRRTSLNNIRWDEKVYLYQDFDFMVQCELSGLTHEWANYNEPDYFYRVFRNGNSVCATIVTEQKVCSTNYLFPKIFHQIGQINNGKRLQYKFFRFVLLHYEQMLLDYHVEYMEKFLSMIHELYPEEHDIMQKIAKKRELNGKTHWSFFKMYLKLYLAYKEPLHRTYTIHELVKFLIYRN